MKKTIVLLCMVAGILSCTKEPITLQEPEVEPGVPMNFEINVSGTKAAKTDWAEGDKIYVFFNGLETKYLILELSGGSWTNTPGGSTLYDTDFAGLGTHTLSAVHFPVPVDVDYADDKFSFTSGGQPVYNYYLFETGKDYSVDETTVTASLSMGKPADMVQIHVNGIQAFVAGYSFDCSLIKPVACKSVSKEGDIIEDVLPAGTQLSGMADSDGAIFAGRLTSPGVAADYIFNLTSECYNYSLTRSNKALTAGKMYNFPAPFKTGGSNWAATPVMVDLGLSVNWTKGNLGAASQENYGDYYAWGEIEPKDVYDWATYKWCNGTSSTLTKYCPSSRTDIWNGSGSPDDKNHFSDDDYADDAARAVLGGKWRTPSDGEWIELRDNCTWIWKTDYNGSGINGYLVTGTNNNSIFLPVAGYRDSSSLNDTDSGHYWFNRLHEDNVTDAWQLSFTSSEPYNCFSFPRSAGLSVRPVCEKFTGFGEEEKW